MKTSKVGLLLLLSFLSLLLAGTAAMGLLSPATYGPDDNGKSVTVNLGDTFLVKLPENPSTGYAWDITLSEGLTRLSDTYESADRSGMRVGVGGTHTWEIKATKNGTQTVRGVYKGPGNQSAASPETYTLTVDVSQGGLLSGLFRLPAMLAAGMPDKSASSEPVLLNIRPGGDDGIISARLQTQDMLTFPDFGTLMSGPLSQAAANGPSQEIKVTHTDVPPPDETVTANVGDTVLVQLSQNPSTGYSWQMAASDGLNEVYNRSLGSMAPQGIVGAPEMHEWAYLVTKPGTQTISGIYKRPWESVSAGEKRYVLKVDTS